MTMLLSLITGGIGKYLIIAAIAAGALAWFAHDMKAPLQREITALRHAATQKEQMAESDRIRAEDAEAEMTRLDAALTGIITDANAKATVCRLSADELGSLQRLARTGGGSRR